MVFWKRNKKKKTASKQKKKSSGGSRFLRRITVSETEDLPSVSVDEPKSKKKKRTKKEKTKKKSSNEKSFDTDNGTDNDTENYIGKRRAETSSLDNSNEAIDASTRITYGKRRKNIPSDLIEEEVPPAVPSETFTMPPESVSEDKAEETPAGIPHVEDTPDSGLEENVMLNNLLERATAESFDIEENDGGADSSDLEDPIDADADDISIKLKQDADDEKIREYSVFDVNDEFHDSAFSVTTGKRVSVLDNVISSEIDSGVDFVPIQKKKIKNTVIIASVIVSVVFLGIIGYMLKETLTASSGNSSKPQENVLAGVLQEATPSQSDVKMKLRGNTFVASGDDDELTANGYKTADPKKNCELNNIVDFCTAGSVEMNNDFTGRVFYTENLVYSNTFKEILEYNQISLQKSGEGKLVANVVVNFAGSPTRFLIFSNNDTGSGWFVKIPIETTKDDAKKISDSFTHTIG